MPKVVDGLKLQSKPMNKAINSYAEILKVIINKSLTSRPRVYTRVFRACEIKAVGHPSP